MDDGPETIGSLPPKQFLYLMLGFGGSYLFYKTLPIMYSIPLIVLLLYFSFVLSLHARAKYIERWGSIPHNGGWKGYYTKRENVLMITLIISMWLFVLYLYFEPLQVYK